ncbi:MAG: ribonuclease P protein component [Anaerolineaceae bacterium]|nr:ribonuclease P protein component [Anaerolineaceae bacterium]
MERRLRLRAPADFERMRRQGRKFQHALFMLSVLPNDLAHNRYGIVTSKRIGKAVVRNRSRRLLREVLRSFHPDLKPGYDVVVIARPAIVGQPFWAVQRIMNELIAQAGLLKLESDQV